MISPEQLIVSVPEWMQPTDRSVSFDVQLHVFLLPVLGTKVGGANSDFNNEKTCQLY